MKLIILIKPNEPKTKNFSPFDMSHKKGNLTNAIRPFLP